MLISARMARQAARLVYASYAPCASIGAAATELRRVYLLPRDIDDAELAAPFRHTIYFESHFALHVGGFSEYDAAPAA